MTPATEQTRLLTRREFHLVGHAGQVNYRSSLHLVHDVASVDFYCCFARSDFGGNLLIEHSGDDESHNLLLARG